MMATFRNRSVAVSENSPLRRIPPLPTVFTSAGILLAGNGMITTLVAVRGRAEGFSDSAIGLIGTAYFAGFLLAAMVIGGLITRVGHIRVFAGLAALAGAATLVMILFVDIWVWGGARMMLGFAFSGIAAVIESWLNEIAGNTSRGRVLSLYRIVDLGSVTAGQFILPVIGAYGFEIFAFAALLFCLALIPVSLLHIQAPPPPTAAGLSIGLVWRVSPVACVGIMTVGMANGAFRTVGPLYASTLGLDIETVALFMTLFIAGGAIFQFPLGWASDRVDRRWVLILATAGAMAASLWLAQQDGGDATTVLAGAAFFGCFALPLYSLSIAHANDRCDPERYVTLAVGLLLFFAFGAMIGAPLSAAIVERFGPAYFFAYTCTLHGFFIAFVVYRMFRRMATPKELRTRFVALLRTSPGINQLGLAEQEERRPSSSDLET